VKYIFLTLAVVGNVLFVTTITLGLKIGDPTERDIAVQTAVATHQLTGLSTLVFASLVHAITLTYFMGTGRWMEETLDAYRIDKSPRRQNLQLKTRTVFQIGICLALLLTTSALGALSDPASPMGVQGWMGIPTHTWHFLGAISTASVNLLVNFSEYFAIARNHALIDQVMQQVHAIRAQHGLS
jgi:uncharacterized membrane protein YciS (DUF1049 family)